MASSIKEVLGAISKEAKRQGIDFYLHRKGKKHMIYRLGTTVTLPVQHSTVPSRIQHEMFKACEPELGYRWWKPEAERSQVPEDLPTTVIKGYRGPRGKRVVHA